MNSKYKISFLWDDEAAVWIATSEDEIGLVLEHESLDTLIQRVRIALPEMLELNGRPRDSILLDYAMARQDRLALHG